MGACVHVWACLGVCRWVRAWTCETSAACVHTRSPSDRCSQESEKVIVCELIRISSISNPTITTAISWNIERAIIIATKDPFLRHLKAGLEAPSLHAGDAGGPLS